MKKVVFFIESEWAFGSIHYELSKYLWDHDYNCHLLPWNKNYTLEELRELDSHIDFWVTTQYGYRFLEYCYGIKAERIITVAHAASDLEELISYTGKKDFDRFRNYGVVSKFLETYSNQLGIDRSPLICQVGINYNTYFAPPSDELRVVGYAGAMHEAENEAKEDPESYWGKLRKIKRGYLVREVAHRAGLEFKVAQYYHNSFITMGGFYRNVDCVINSSTKEGAGLPSLEAAAAGKLVIGTPVGHWRELIGENGGIEVPIQEEDFIRQCVDMLIYYKNNPTEYKKRCVQIQEHAKTYDWKNYINSWVKLLQ